MQFFDIMVPMTPRTTPKDFFLHLAATVALYAAAIALINLSFSIINYAVPDKLAGYFSSTSIAWPISMLVILVPLLYILEWLIVRDIGRMPEKRDLWVRRWRIYLTLFLAGATIIGDLIALINTYLSGELTSRFLYKILAILIICGVIFAYYLMQRIDSSDISSGRRKLVGGIGIVIVLAAIIGGFVIVGSPATQRAYRFDSQRINDLSNIQWQIINNWQIKGKLPANLSELGDKLSGQIVPMDPETEQPYEYTIKSPTTFEICANFSRDSQDLKGRGEFGYGGGGFGGVTSYPAMPYPDGNGDTWKHGVGRTCFERTIDPERYPPTPKQKPIPM